MKRFLISALAIASIVACSKDEVVDQQNTGVAIAFEQAFVENATRAAEDPSTTTATITAFDVWGFMDVNAGVVFNQQRVTKNGNNWTYSPQQYWLPNHVYYFGALAPVENAHWTLDTSNAGQTGVGTVSFENVNGTEDLLYASTSVDTNGTKVGQDMPKVGLTFSHLLSKVKFSFTNGFASPNYTISVKNIKMIVPAKAEIALVGDWWSTNKWEQYNGTTTLEFGDMESEKIQVTKGAESQKERLTIPAPATQEYTVTFDVELYQGAVLAYSNSLSTTISGAELKIGNAYNFHATLDHTNIAGDALDPIEFDVTKVNEWVDGNGYEGNVIDTEVVGVKNADELVAAVNNGAEHIQLLDNINMNEPLVFTPKTRATITNYTFDLNGKNIVAPLFAESNGSINAGYTDSYAFWVKDGASLTINGEGTVSTQACKYSIAVWAQGGNVTINGGTYQNAGEGSDLIYASANGHIVINGGTFIANEKQAGVDGTQEKHSALNLKGDGTASSITVYGGSFFKFDPYKNKSENPPVSFVADGYESVAEGDYFVVVPALKQHSVATADQLFAAVNAGGKITLTENIAISTPVIVNAGQKVVVNLNGKNITAGKWAEAGSNDATESYAFWAKGGELVINGEGTVSTEACKYSMAVWANGGKVTINGGTYKNAGEGSDLIYASNGSVVDINGGTFEACVKQPGTDGTMNNRSALNCKDGDYRAGKAGFVVKGGKFLEFNPADNASEVAHTDFCADGKTVEKDGNYFIVK